MRYAVSWTARKAGAIGAHGTHSAVSMIEAPDHDAAMEACRLECYAAGLEHVRTFAYRASDDADRAARRLAAKAASAAVRERFPWA